MRRKQNTQTQQSWLFLFSFSPPLLFRFSCLIFFSLAGHLVGFILVGRVFRKAFRILGLGERKGRWAVEQDFHGNFQVNVTWFFAFFSGVLDWIVLIRCRLKDLFTLHKLAEKLSLTIKTDDVISGRKYVDTHARLRCERVRYEYMAKTTRSFVDFSTSIKGVCYVRSRTFCGPKSQIFLPFQVL